MRKIVFAADILIFILEAPNEFICMLFSDMSYVLSFKCYETC